MKTCNRCGQRKPDDKFHRVFASGKFYLHGYCKLCQRILARERWRRNQLLLGEQNENIMAAR